MILSSNSIIIFLKSITKPPILIPHYRTYVLYSQ
nr:MAG TPA: hypothetical protein [Bacteriophage sp.]